MPRENVAAQGPLEFAGEPAAPLERGQDTRERLLDAAELLFGQRGFEGTSLRALTRAAGTSVSAAHYHFGSKEALLRAVLLRRIGPVNERRLALLDALEEDAAGAPLPLEQLLDAYLRPVFELRAAQFRNPARMVAARLYADPPELVSALKQELFGELSRRFIDALARALPHRPRHELALAFQFTVGVMVHVASGHLQDAPHLEAPASEGGPLSDDFVLRRMIAFVAAGLRAPRKEPQ